VEICHYRASEFVDSSNVPNFNIRLPEFILHRNPSTTGNRRRIPADQIPIESGRNPAGSGQIWPKWKGFGH
jgi:hypothetical protein